MPLDVPGWPLQRLEAHATTVLSREGVVVYASEAFLRLTGLPADRVVGVRAPRAHLDPASAENLDRALELALSGTMARLGICSGEIQLPARPGPLLRCRFEYEGVPNENPDHHVFVYERVEGASQGMDGALYQMYLVPERLGAGRPHREIQEAVGFTTLTEQDLEVVKLLLGGLSKGEIARQLQVPVHSVQAHVRAVFRKLKVQSRDEFLARFGPSNPGGDRRSDPGTDRKQRAHPRYRVNAQAIWRVDGVETRWPVWTLSRGGAALVVGSHGLPAGTRLHVHFAQPRWDLGNAHAEVIYTSGKRMGLRFLEIDAVLQRALDELFAELTPLS